MATALRTNMPVADAKLEALRKLAMVMVIHAAEFAIISRAFDRVFDLPGSDVFIFS